MMQLQAVGFPEEIKLGKLRSIEARSIPRCPCAPKATRRRRNGSLQILLCDSVAEWLLRSVPGFQCLREEAASRRHHMRE